jgi:hypothetical protein
MLARDVVRMSHDDAIEQGMSEATFKSIDADGDGHLTAAEISEWKDQHPTGLSDGDGGGGGSFGSGGGGDGGGVGGGEPDGGMTLEEMFDITKTHTGASGAGASGGGGVDGGEPNGGMTLEEMFDLAKTHVGASGAGASGGGGGDGAAMVQELDGYESDDYMDL